MFETNGKKNNKFQQRNKHYFLKSQMLMSETKDKIGGGGRNLFGAGSKPLSLCQPEGTKVGGKQPKKSHNIGPQRYEPSLGNCQTSKKLSKEIL